MFQVTLKRQFLLFSFYSLTLLLGQPSATSPEFFESKIRPVLANSCFGCHSNSAMGGLRVDSLEGLQKGGEHGAVLKPGDPTSPLIARLKEANVDLRMPKGGKLKPTEIADLEAWVKAGAVWPKSVAVTAASNGVNMSSRRSGEIFGRSSRLLFRPRPT